MPMAGLDRRFPESPWNRGRSLTALTLPVRDVEKKAAGVAREEGNGRTDPQAAEDPHPWERREMVEVPDFLAGEIAVSGEYWHFSRTPVNISSTPQVGEHNEDVLAGILGYSEGQIEQFR